jgi:UDP-GlcNAc:undecaprenyl-phosphate GlcNAc-1-phosphate transferase
LPLEARSLIGLALATALAYWATPLAIRLADRYDFYDRPRGYRAHSAPTPYLGGLAVMAAFALALVSVGVDWQRTLPILAGAVVMCAVGTVDDKWTLTPGVRLVVEAGAGVALWALDLGWNLGLGAAVDLAATVLWIIAVVNAFNLFDNMDGAASSMAAVVSGGLAVLAVVEGNAWLAVAGVALAGACLGFLPHNLASPSRIFLGDGGSMPIGFAVAALTMVGVSESAPSVQSLAMGLLLVGVPALDTMLVIVSRVRRGVSILTGGRDHLTHRALMRLRTTRAVALTLGGGQALISALAVVAIGQGSAVIVPLVAIYIVLAGVAITYLDTRLVPATSAAADAVPAEAAEPRAPLRLSISIGLLAVIGIAAGLSPLADGYYDASLWVPGGLAVVALAAGLAIARPALLTRPAAVALGTLAALGVWALVSSMWAESVEQAVVAANRLLVYAALLGVLLLLMRSRRAATAGMVALAAAGFALAAIVLFRMLDGDQTLFLRGRLHEPLGYINGQGNFFLLAVWPALALAERRRPWLSAAGLALTSAAAGLAFLSQSRGLVVAALATIIVLLAAIPGRTRRAWALVLVAAILAAEAPLLLDIYHESIAESLTDGTVRTAALVIIAGALVAGGVWRAAEVLTARLDADRGRWLATRGLAALAALAVVGTLVLAPKLADTVESQYRGFVSLGAQSSGNPTSRLLSGGGTRYDYWRIALDLWREHPVAGAGAGSYDVTYFRERRTDEDVRQPHSLVLQTLSELGLVGLALLLAFAGAIFVGLRRTVLAARGSPRERVLAVAAGGIVVTWAVHSSIDWLHLLPGLTAAVLVASAALLSAPRPTPVPAVAAAAAPARRTPRYAAAIAIGVVLAITAISLNRQGLSEYFRDRAQSALAADPERALVEVDRSLRVDPSSVDAYYIKAAALARFGEAEAARRALLEAARREPGNFVTYALLGDLALRTGHFREADKLYRRSLALNPRDGKALSGLVLATNEQKNNGPGPPYPESE